MASFRFSLEKVLRWRSIQVATEEAKLKKLLQEQLQLQKIRAEIGAEEARLASSLGTLQGLSGADLRAAHSYSLLLRKQAEKLLRHLSKVEQELTTQKAAYRQAKQRCRLLEELRSRKLAEWTYEQARELDALVSESYLANWGREHI